MYELKENDKKFNISTKVSSKINLLNDFIDADYGYDYIFSINNNFALDKSFDDESRLLSTMNIKFESKHSEIKSFEDSVFLDIDDLTSLRNLIDDAIQRIQHQKEKITDNLKGMRLAEHYIIDTDKKFEITVDFKSYNDVLLTFGLLDEPYTKLYQIESDFTIHFYNYFANAKIIIDSNILIKRFIIVELLNQLNLELERVDTLEERFVIKDFDQVINKLEESINIIYEERLKTQKEIFENIDNIKERQANPDIVDMVQNFYNELDKNK